MSKTFIDARGLDRRQLLAALAAAGIAFGTASIHTAGATEAKDDSDSKDAKAQDQASPFPVTIAHAFGETTIESMPERVVTAGWSVHDVPLALGVAPVACEAANFGVKEGETLLPWSAEAFSELGVDDPVTIDNNDGYDFEAISDAQPDIILCTYSGVTREDYEELSKIAPTVPYPETAWSIPWRTNIEMIAEALGKKEEGDQLIEDLETLMTDKAKEYGVNGQSVAFLNVSATDMGTLYFYIPTDGRGSYLVDLGYTCPQSILDIAGDTTDFYIQMSSEDVDKLSDVEGLVVYGDEAFKQQIMDDALLSLIPAVANGRLAMVDGSTPIAAACNPTCLSIPATIDEYLQLIQGVMA